MHPLRAEPYFLTPEYPSHLGFSPDSAEALMKQYIILTYGDEVSIKDVTSGLEGVENVGYLQASAEQTAGLSAGMPNDEFFLESSVPRADLTYTNNQWYMHYPHGLMRYVLERSWGWGTVGVIDSGPDVTHPDLDHAFSFLNSFDFKGNTRTLSLDTEANLGFHGTHVTGIIGARAKNVAPGGTVGRGVVGFCPECSIVYGASITPEQQANAGLWLAAWGAQAINMSGWIGNQVNHLPPPTTPCATHTTNPHPFCLVLKYMEERDVAFVAAAGNLSAGTVHPVDFPAREPNAFAVAGTDYYSAAFNVSTLWNELHWNDPNNWPGGCPMIYNGPTGIEECGSNDGPEIDFIAPARTILSTVPVGVNYVDGICSDASFPPNNDGYGYCTGTSMSAPQITGLFGLFRSMNPLLTVGTISAAMREEAGGAVRDAYLSGRMPETLTDRLLYPAENRLTPMFSLRNAAAKDRLYTAKLKSRSQPWLALCMRTPHA